MSDTTITLIGMAHLVGASLVAVLSPRPKWNANPNTNLLFFFEVFLWPVALPLIGASWLIARRRRPSLPRAVARMRTP
jgi:hypothetical protein